MAYKDNDNILRSYGYTYDEMNRLKGSYYQKEYTETNSYDEHLTYDKNGNILTLNRNGFLDQDYSGVPYPIDELSYFYANNYKSNRLVSVVDHTNSIDGFKDGNLSGMDYFYDEFGNMTADRNKGIDKIYYNHLNLPTKIVFSNSSEIYYIYNAVGSKIRKRVVSATQGYDLDGRYLGNDAEGFSGEVLFMDEKIFRLLSPGGTDMNGDSNISHETAKQYSQSLSQVIGKNSQNTFTQQTLNMINNAITDVSNKTGYDTGKLHNGKVSSSYFVDDIGTSNDLALISNDGSLGYSLASTDHSSPPIISFMIQQWHRIGLTVENIESTMFHEYGGHFKRNVPGDEFISTMIKHRDLINEQMNRPSFKNTTKEYQKNMLGVRNMYNTILTKNGVK